MFEKRTIVSLFAAAAVVASLAVAATPVSAGPPIECNGNADTTPDGKMNANGGPFQGAGTYTDQHINVVLDGPGQAVFLLKWKNVGDVPHTIRVKDATNFAVHVGTVRKFFVDGVNVSKEMRQQGRLVFSGVQPGKRVTIEVVLKIRDTGMLFTGVRLQGRYRGNAPQSCDELTPLIND